MAEPMEITGQRLINSLYLALDEQRYAEAAACFSQHGEWHRKGQVLKGPTEVEAAFEGRAESHRVRHVVSNLIFRPAERGGDFSFYVTAYVGSADAHGVSQMPGPAMVLTCDGYMTRIGAVWKIGKLTTTRQFVREQSSD